MRKSVNPARSGVAALLDFGFRGDSRRFSRRFSKKSRRFLTLITSTMLTVRQ